MSKADVEIIPRQDHGDQEKRPAVAAAKRVTIGLVGTCHPLGPKAAHPTILARPLIGTSTARGQRYRLAVNRCIADRRHVRQLH